MYYKVTKNTQSKVQLFTFDPVFKFLKIILFPFSLLYSVILRIRHLLYDSGLLKSHSYETPVIGIGNLSLGGTGKSPFTAFLAEVLIKDGHSVAIVSRGYKRKTSGVIFGNNNHTAQDIGDEPRMYIQNLKEVTVVVSENRTEAIEALINSSQPPDVILLDDCFQHRKVNPSLLFLLTEEKRPYWRDFLVPTGYLRDIKWASRRADALVVTKMSSPNGTIQLPDFWSNRPVFHSEIHYYSPIGINTNEQIDSQIISFSALADDQLFKEQLSQSHTLAKAYSFSDHHLFTDAELMEIISYCNAQKTSTSIITTQKDLARLSSHQTDLFKEVKLFVLPIKTPVRESKKFDEYIKTFLGLKE